MTPPAEARPGVDVAAIRARVEKATKGPWRFWDNRGKQALDWSGRPSGSPLPEAYQGVIIDGFDRTLSNPADSEFIAHAREDVPALLDALEDAREALRWIAEVAEGQHPDEFDSDDEAADGIAHRARRALGESGA